MLDNERAMPHSLDAEMAALGAVLIKPSVIDILRTGLQVDDFFLPAHREVFDAMLGVSKRDRPVDVIAVVDELKARGMLARLQGGEGYLLALAGAVPTAENVTHYMEIVSEKARTRQIIAACAETMSRAYGGARVDELLESVSSTMNKIATGSTSEMVLIGDLNEQLMEEFERRQQNNKDGISNVTGIRTGITKLDIMTAGFQPQEVITIAADTGAGKTALAMQTAEILAGEPDGMVIAFNMEMPRAQLAERSFVRNAKINSQFLKTGAIEYKDFVRLQTAAGKIAQQTLYLEEQVFTLREIEAKCRRLRAKFPSKKRFLGIVDYIQIMGSGTPKENRAREIGIITKGIKQLAKKLNMTFIILSQLNRDGVKGKAKNKDGTAAPPTMHDLKESGDIEQDSDIIIILHNPHEVDDGDIMLYVVKHRNGAKKKTPVHWIGRHYTFTDPEIDPGPSYEDNRLADP